MSGPAMTEKPDWMIPAILVATIAVLMIVGGIVIGVRAVSEPDNSVAGQLERWTTCLRSNGASVPLVESMPDGGFRVTVDGGMLDDGLDHEKLRPALGACENDAPEAVQGFMSLAGGLSDMPFADLGDDLFELSDLFGLDDRP